MKVKAQTLSEYHSRINEVVNYINNHLNEELDLVKLAALGNYSTFHFHRIMRAYLGESLGAYVLRKRLEASLALIRFSDMAIGDLAFKVGYENPSSFNKAFKKRYGISPAAYRKNNQLLQKNNEAKFKCNAMENLKNLEPEITTLETKNVVFARAFGNYHESAKVAWDKVCAFAVQQNLFGINAEFIGISHNDPDVTAKDKLQYDACIVTTKEIKPEGEIGVQEVEGGVYAVFMHLGSYGKLKNSYDFIFGKWLPESGRELRNVPCFEKYLNDVSQTKEEDLKTEICIPIE